MAKNRLAKEKSPYLRQHADNPVDWHPWGEEAITLAKKEDKPIFLSIGYATCHWCHVMERESFNNHEIAKELNAAFICIKVDREELPAVDALYMELAQTMLAQAAGWPLNLVLTPDLKPIYAATYLPPEPRGRLPSIYQVIRDLKEIWNSSERKRVEERAGSLMKLFEGAKEVEDGPLPTPALLSDALEVLFRASDPVNGGWYGSPKFPMGYRETLLILYSLLKKESRALFLAERTLERMALGGLHDMLGGGFSRYTVDERWMIPHFEKMLYDNALLLDAYLMGYQATGEPLFKEVALKSAEYLVSAMQSEEGGFFSAEDSETHGMEGLYYSWPESELKMALGERADLFCKYFGITSKGNFNGRNILFAELTPRQFANQEGIDLEEFKTLLATSKSLLFKIRQTSEPPFKDQKIITAWNALAAHALLNAGVLLEREEFTASALKALRFIEEKMTICGKLMRRFAEGEAKHAATLEDFAFYIRALLTAYELGHGESYLEQAVHFTQILEEEFASKKGPYFQSREGEFSLQFRNMHYSDGSEPSGNAVQTENLLRLHTLTGEERHKKRAEEILKATLPHIRTYPPGFLYHLMNMLRLFRGEAPHFQFTYRNHEEKRAIQKKLLSKMIPFLSVSWKKGKETSLTICREGRCNVPLVGIESVISKLST